MSGSRKTSGGLIANHQQACPGLILGLRHWLTLNGERAADAGAAGEPLAHPGSRVHAGQRADALECLVEELSCLWQLAVARLG